MTVLATTNDKDCSGGNDGVYGGVGDGVDYGEAKKRTDKGFGASVRRYYTVLLEDDLPRRPTVDKIFFKNPEELLFLQMFDEAASKARGDRGRVWLQTLKEEITNGKHVCNVTGEEEGGFRRRLQVAGGIKIPNRDEFRKGLGQYHLRLRRNSRPAAN
ncbi:hypothetical protein U1Q18_004523 [Sarracenia purpurea var. burkii]